MFLKRKHLPSYDNAVYDGQIGRLPPDARRPLRLRQASGLLYRLGPGGVGVVRQDRQDLGCQQRRLPAEARGLLSPTRPSWRRCRTTGALKESGGSTKHSHPSYYCRKLLHSLVPPSSLFHSFTAHAHPY